MTTWQDFFATQDLTHIRKWIAYTRSLGVAVYPSDQDVFRAFDLTPLDQVRVVILGQDPYFNGEADGLAFSAGKAKRLPLSLQRIVAEVKDDGFEVASTWRGSLESWARQGVLLLNTALTVQHGTPGVYMQNWSRFVGDALRFVVRERQPHFILWGSAAMDVFKGVAMGFKAPFLLGFEPGPYYTKQSNFATYTYSAHPAARSATPNPLKGSRPFSKANEVLRWRRRGDVDWSLR
jgi:uracil-DNA glycosylase